MRINLKQHEIREPFINRNIVRYLFVVALVAFVAGVTADLNSRAKIIIRNEIKSEMTQIIGLAKETKNSDLAAERTHALSEKVAKNKDYMTPEMWHEYDQLLTATR